MRPMDHPCWRDCQAERRRARAALERAFAGDSGARFDCLAALERSRGLVRVIARDCRTTKGRVLRGAA